ncbi:TEA domain-containing protein [Mycena venus]|uniref:TEA domain-containing protein n=1 Tax=Mycena venus TaxID=2733690 RepID=A0A8H7CK54_9AGAR|nr:TEA domain-containing protein [Mycena venus]
MSQTTTLPLPTLIPMDDSQAPSTSKSLTPQRKHRKLLKDGSGTAVWPESIEAVFVQGLREYWDSPWATYSRGRSRWRNQFLVDYLQNLGITRSKKQVASHIQVLRNMWKGEPGKSQLLPRSAIAQIYSRPLEYHLVAGGEELFQDPVKQEAQDVPALFTIDDHEDDFSSPDNSPPGVLQEFPPSPAPAPGLTYSPSSPLSSLSSDIDSPPHTFSHLAGPYSYAPNQKAYAAAGYAAFAHAAPTPNAPAPVRYPNRTTSLTLLADGMTAFSVNIDKLAPPVPLPARTPPLALRIRLAIPPVDDTRAPPNLHGFFGNVRLASVWASQAKVFTRVYDNTGRCFSNEVEPLHPSNVELGTVVAALPESALSRARWLDPTVQTTITQQIVVDNATLLFIVYELDRRSQSALPSAELIIFQKYTSSTEVNPKQQPPSPTAYAPPYAQQPPSANFALPTTAAGAVYPAPSSSQPGQTYTPNGYYAAPVAGVYTHPPAQTVMYGHAHPPPTNTAYTPSLSSALTPVPVPLRS